MSIALFSIAGIIVGATLQYVFTRVLEDRRHFRDLRTQAYSDYLRAVSEVHHLLIQPQANRERELLARLTDAKARVCLFGSKDVLELLATFERLGGKIQSPEQQLAFTGVLGAMRHSSDVAGTDLEAVALGPRR